METTKLDTKHRKYNHLTRTDTRATYGIETGKVYIFPKIDGTNASVWWDDEKKEIQAGSRTRTLSLEADNAGFYAWVLSDDPKAIRLREWCEEMPDHIVYMEWLVPHTLKTYREDAWRRAYIFDVFDRGTRTYWTFEEYSEALIGLDILEPLCTIQDPSYDQLIHQMEANTYLIQDGLGAGEGIVLKNYEWYEKGKTWAKFVRNEFKEKNGKVFGTNNIKGKNQVEAAIAEEFVTLTLVNKTRAKVRLDVANEVDALFVDDEFWDVFEQEHKGKIIPQLLGRVFHDIIEEEMWNILKKHKKATINFGILQGQVTLKVKEFAKDLMG